MRVISRFLAAVILMFSTIPAWAGEPEILSVSASRPDMTWDFQVTLRHSDTGWDHYADGWEVLDTKGNRLGYRELHHPHVDEQPFTRTLRGVVIPDGVRMVVVRAHCSVHGWSSTGVEVTLSPTGHAKTSP